jgi:hypothetical protein
MRYRLSALALVLIGFLGINYTSNTLGQRALRERPLSVTDPSTGAIDERYRREQEGIALLESLVDTLDALGVQTEAGARLRQHYRRSLEELERLRTVETLSRTLWQQTLLDVIWGVVAAVGLLPLGGWLDERARSRPPRIRPAPGPVDATDGM